MIQYAVNMANERRRLNAAQQHFVENMGQLMATWGLPRNTGRLYAYLLLRAAPVSLDEIAADIGVAKSGASVGARQLTTFGLARASGERGSRRIRYEPVYALEPMFEARQRQFAALMARFHEGARAAPAGAPRQRLVAMANTLERVVDGVAAGIVKAQRREA